MKECGKPAWWSSCQRTAASTVREGRVWERGVAVGLGLGGERVSDGSMTGGYDMERRMDG
jgi:hypothetical protein